MIQSFSKNEMKQLLHMKKRPNVLINLVRSLRKSEPSDRLEKLKRSANWLKLSIVVMCILGIASMTTGCTSLTKSSVESQPPANAASPCPPLTPLQGKTGKHVAEKLVEIGSMYNDCSAKHNALIEWVENGN